MEEEAGKNKVFLVFVLRRTTKDFFSLQLRNKTATASREVSSLSCRFYYVFFPGERGGLSPRCLRSLPILHSPHSPPPSLLSLSFPGSLLLLLPTPFPSSSSSSLTHFMPLLLLHPLSFITPPPAIAPSVLQPLPPFAKHTASPGLASPFPPPPSSSLHLHLPDTAHHRIANSSQSVALSPPPYRQRQLLTTTTTYFSHLCTGKRRGEDLIFPPRRFHQERRRRSLFVSEEGGGVGGDGGRSGRKQRG